MTIKVEDEAIRIALHRSLSQAEMLCNLTAGAIHLDASKDTPRPHVVIGRVVPAGMSYVRIFVRGYASNSDMAHELSRVILGAMDDCPIVISDDVVADMTSGVSNVWREANGSTWAVEIQLTLRIDGKRVAA